MLISIIVLYKICSLLHSSPPLLIPRKFLPNLASLQKQLARASEPPCHHYGLGKRRDEEFAKAKLAQAIASESQETCSCPFFLL